MTPVFKGRTKRCKTCGRVKPVTEFANRGHQSCAACVAFTHGGKAVVPIEPVPIIQHELYDGADLRPFEGRLGALDAYKLPSRGAFQ